MKIEISEMLARVLQRMIVEEMHNQVKWSIDDRKLGCNNETYRNAIIFQLSLLADAIEQQGIEKYIKCF